MALRLLSVCSSVVFLPVALDLDIHDDRMLDEVGVLLDDLAQAVLLEELLGILAEVQDDVGAAGGALGRLDGELALAVGFPLRRPRASGRAERVMTVTRSATMKEA